MESSVVSYDRELVPWLFDHWAEPLVDLLAPEPSSRIVDIACGSGLIVRKLVDRLDDTGGVFGVDLDPAMLTYAAATVAGSRASWIESDATRLPFQNNSMNHATCHQGLQFFPDRYTALTEVRRVLQPGGRLVLATWGALTDNPWPNALARAVDQLLGEDAAADMAKVCALGDPVELAELIRNAGFSDVVVEQQARTVTHDDVRAAAAGQIAALPSGSAVDERSEALEAELVVLMCELLAEYIDAGGRLAAPSTANLVLAVEARQ